MEGSGLGYREEGLDLVEAARLDHKVYERVPDMGGLRDCIKGWRPD